MDDLLPQVSSAANNGVHWPLWKPECDAGMPGPIGHFRSGDAVLTKGPGIKLRLPIPLKFEF